MLNFHRERWNPAKKHSKALVFFAVSKQIHIVYSADRGRAEIRLHHGPFLQLFMLHPVKGHIETHVKTW